jgi:hypothetical protein
MKIPLCLILCTLAAGLVAQTTSNSPATPPVVADVPSVPAPILLPQATLDKLTPLFDGKTLDGWDYTPTNWSVQDGAMRGTGAWCMACTKADYDSFRLLVTSRLVFPATNKGSDHLGILFWGDRPVKDAKGNYTPKGTGMLTLQPPYGSIWAYGPNKNVPVDHIIPKDDNRLRWHDWHTSEVLANLKTGEIRMAVDGVEIIHYKAEDPSVWKKGPIGMQIHGSSSVVEYKDIRIEENPKDEKLITVK